MVASSLADVISLVGLVAGLLVGGLYALGVIVVANHLANYGVTSFRALRLRFVTAGALYAVLTGLPIAAGLSAGISWSRGHDGSFPLRILGVTGFLGFGYILFKVVLYICRIEPRWAFYWFDWLYFLGLFAAAATAAGSGYVPWSPAGDTWSIADFHQLAVLVLGLPLTLAHFSKFYYPDFKNGVGGGAAWLVHVVAKREAASEVASFLTQDVRLVDRDGDALRLLVQDGDSWRAMEVWWPSIEGMTVRGVSRLPAEAFPSLQFVRERGEAKRLASQAARVGRDAKPSSKKKRGKRKRSQTP